jgi:hypothetical protein
MRFGMHLRELSRQRLGLLLSLAFALFLALSVGYHVSLAPPGLQKRSIEVGSASTQVLVDTPKTIVLDLKKGTGDFTAMTDRAVLIGNVMASLPVRQYIARRAHIPADVIQTSTPLTVDQPRPVAGPESQKHTSDLFKSMHEYRLNIQVNPTVPVLSVYAQAPSARAAEELANAAVDGTRDYLVAVAKTNAVADAQQVRLSQLGKAHGGVIDKGARMQAVLLVFFISLGACSATVLFVARVRRGWTAAAQADGVALRQPKEQL